MRGLVILMAVTILSLPAQAANILKVAYRSQADFKACVVTSKSDADALIYVAPRASEAKTPYHWFFTNIPSQATYRVFFTKSRAEAHIKIYFVQHAFESGPKKKTIPPPIK